MSNPYIEAFEKDDFERFKELVRSSDGYCADYVACTLARLGDRKFLKELLSHEKTRLDRSAVSCLLRYITEECDIMDLIFARLRVDDASTIQHLLYSVADTYDPKALEIVLRHLSKDHDLCIDFLAHLLYTHIRSVEINRPDENPIDYIRAFTNAGIDISGFHYVLSDYLYYGMNFPGVARELVKHGIPKSAAYVTKYLKSARYRSRLLMELS